jgi:acyl carrier protein
MTDLTERDLTDLIIKWVREHRQPGKVSDDEINEYTDLMAAGLLDSFGFIDLLLYIEIQNGVKIDLNDVDPSKFTVVMGLCSIALENRNHNGNQPRAPGTSG